MKDLAFRKWWLLFLGLAACGGGAREAVRGAGAMAPTSPAVASGGPSRADTRAAAQQPGSPSGAESSSTRSADARAWQPPPTPAPEERPGLGTEWGESLRSRVRDVAFVRSDAERPFAITTFRYDDRDGVDAMVRRAGGDGRARGTAAEIVATGGVTMSLRDGDGDPLDAVRVGGETLVVGRSGERYSVVLTNHTRHRFEAVVTVDGLDVVNGRPGSVRHRGYLVMPFSSVTIDGFRRSQDAVAAFRFASVRDAYASKVGSARDVGVVGAAFFAERGDVPTDRETSAEDDEEARLRATATPFPASDRFARPPRRR